MRMKNTSPPLLAKPSFGEHWAQMWLDLARYADSSGIRATTARDLGLP